MTRQISFFKESHQFYSELLVPLANTEFVLIDINISSFLPGRQALDELNNIRSQNNLLVVRLQWFLL